MADYKITGRQLSKATGLSEVAISQLKNSRVLPEIGGNKLGLLAKSLSDISGRVITPLDLVSNIID